MKREREREEGDEKQGSNERRQTREAQGEGEEAEVTSSEQKQNKFVGDLQVSTTPFHHFYLHNVLLFFLPSTSSAEPVCQVVCSIWQIPDQPAAAEPR